MATQTFSSQVIRQQLAQRSGQVSVRQSEGGWQFIDDLSGNQLSGPTVSSSLLANPQRPNDPRITAQALDLAKSYYSDPTIPPALTEAIATVAAYVSATRGIPVPSLFSSTGMTPELLQAYNSFKPKGSQVGVLLQNQLPRWTNNPTLRGSISAAITR